jgi:hypothetical protein
VQSGARSVKRKKKLDPWEQLGALIRDYGEWCRSDEMKGGGDPEYMPVVEAELALARARLNAHINEMRRMQE